MDNYDYGFSIFNALYDRGNKIIKKKEMKERKAWSRLFEKSLKEGFNNYTIIDSPSIYYHDEGFYPSPHYAQPIDLSSFSIDINSILNPGDDSSQDSKT